MASIRNTPRRGIISRKFCGWRWWPTVRKSGLMARKRFQCNQDYRLSSWQSPVHCQMAAAIVDDLNVFFCCCNMLHSIAHAAAFFNWSIVVAQPCGNLPPLHSWSSPRSRHKRRQKLPPERCGDQRWSCIKTLMGGKNTKSQCHKNRKTKLRTLEKLL